MSVQFPKFGTAFESAIANRIIASIEKWADSIVSDLRRAPIRSVSGTASLTLTDQFVVADMSGGNVTISLPTASTWMIARCHQITIKRSGGANTLTIQRTGSDTIDGATSVSPARDKTAMTFVAVAGGWLVMGAYSTVYAV